MLLVVNTTFPTLLHRVVKSLQPIQTMTIVADYTSPSFVVTKSSLPLLNNSQLLIVEQEEHSQLLLLM